MSRLITFILGVGAGVAAKQLMDPGRRNQLRDQAMSKARSAAGSAATTATHAAQQAKGAAASAAPSVPGSHKIDDVDDVTLARKVETEIFRDADAPKGDVSVNVEDGVVYLRGQLEDQAQIDRLGEAAREVAGVQGVKNLLHAPGEPAPAKK
jgi:osmotically-inducible protein OsmY